MDNTAKPTIGKFVIENLTVGMYDNPRCVYREYVQNSADAIDKAVAQNLIDNKTATIHIQINSELKTITIEDNGTGVAARQFVSVLRDVAQSEKEIGKEKGFRGIGRLGGLAYCEKLIFETSAAGEAIKSVMVWDAKKLKQIVSDRTQKEEAAQVIAAVTDFQTEAEQPAAHYFRVVLSNVTNAELLDEGDVKDYLKMVAPLPFDSHFIFRHKIYEELRSENIEIDEYNVFINSEQIYKGYSGYFHEENNGKRKSLGEVRDVKFFKEDNNRGEALFWGWHSVSTNQNKILPKVNRARGLRLRKSNIQIGDEDRLINLFRDSRFNFYVVGEVYALHSQLIPNGRRDDFEDAAVYSQFKEKLKPICNYIQRLSNDASDITSAVRDINDLQALNQTFLEKQKNGFDDKEDAQKFEIELEKKKEKAQKAEKTLNKFQDTIKTQGEDAPLAKIYREATKNAPAKVADIVIAAPPEKIVFRTDKITSLSKAERKLLSKVFSTIRNVLSAELAKNLIKKIEEDFK